MTGVSFRDPGGQVLISGSRVFRSLNAGGQAQAEAFLASPAVRQCVSQHRIVWTQRVEPASVATELPASFLSGAAGLLEHERIFFPSYAFEWSPQMLHAAGELTLDLAEQLLEEGLGLKDATPYNILFDGPQPVFVDVLSMERRNARDPIWLAKSQFERTFVLPLLAARHFELTPDRTFLKSREGIEPERMYALCSPLRRLAPAFFAPVTLAVWLGTSKRARSEALYSGRTAAEPAVARFILQRLFRKLRRRLTADAPSARTSAWARYEMENSYSEEAQHAKEVFVREVMHEHAPETVLDMGCNTGRFSRIAAQGGAKVVAVDSDPFVVGKLWETASKERLDILPLVVDIAQPSPGCGWRNVETASFLERAAGTFRAVFMLALIHHLLVTERIPLREILALAATLTRSLVLIEFIGRDDPLFRQLCRGRLELHESYTNEAFELAAREYFDIVRCVTLAHTHRKLYLLSKRQAA